MSPFRALDPVDPPDQWDEISDCALVKVAVEVPMLAEDDQEEFVFADLDQAAYVEPVRAMIERVRDAVVTTEPQPGAADESTALGGPCPFTLDGSGLPAPEPHEVEPGPDDLEGVVGVDELHPRSSAMA